MTKSPTNTLGALLVLAAAFLCWLLARWIWNRRQERLEVRLGEPQALTKEVFEQLIEEEKRLEAAQFPEYPYRFSITIFLPLGPMERGERFEDPLSSALGEFGMVKGGGTFSKEVDGKMVITDCGFSVRTKDLEKGLAIIRKCLLDQGAPHDTQIRLTEPREADYHLND